MYQHPVNLSSSNQVIPRPVKLQATEHPGFNAIYFNFVIVGTLYMYICNIIFD